ncbi:hypothetical protein ENHAE0001_0499 [Enhydrobacter aerosaccus SK60]|nr:hypothetical protein ENHAE0001_0499 [Enhydrobacter aerosaccus SK60]
MLIYSRALTYLTTQSAVYANLPKKENTLAPADTTILNI